VTPAGDGILAMLLRLFAALRDGGVDVSLGEVLEAVAQESGIPITIDAGVDSRLRSARFGAHRLEVVSFEPTALVVLIGLGAGCAAAFAATRYLESSLFNVSATDPLTFVLVAFVLLFVTLVAQSVPVMRATRVDPSVALRQE